MVIKQKTYTGLIKSYVIVFCLTNLITLSQECVTDIRVGNLKSSYGNHIKASDSFMAFNVDAGGRPLSIRGPQLG